MTTKFQIILVALLAWATIIPNASATGQSGERLVWDGKEYQMLTCPLFDNPDMKQWHKQMEKDWTSTDLWRGYVGHWSIENGMLYLDSIATSKTISPQDIRELRKYCKNGRVAATWFSDTLRVVSGMRVQYEHFGFNRHYEHEDYIAVKNGKVVSVRRMENKLLIKGNQEEKKFKQFCDDLGSQLHQRYPDVNGRILMQVQYCDFDAQQMPTNVKVKYVRNAPTNQQLAHELEEKLSNYILANRVFPLYFINGEYTQEKWTFPINL